MDDKRNEKTGNTPTEDFFTWVFAIAIIGFLLFCFVMGGGGGESPVTDADAEYDMMRDAPTGGINRSRPF